MADLHDGADGPRRPDLERWERERAAMIHHHLRSRGITDERVLDAMARVPREAFVPERERPSAYADSPLPIGMGQTISQPFVVAWMAQLARLRANHRVLEVGTGSGYAAAVYSELAATVVSLERLPRLGHEASDRLQRLGYTVHVHVADGELGWPQASPFDAILVAAATERIPPAWAAQLAIGGRIVVPMGGPSFQQMCVFTSRMTAAGPVLDRVEHGAVRFVPLLPGIDAATAGAEGGRDSRPAPW